MKVCTTRLGFSLTSLVMLAGSASAQPCSDATKLLGSAPAQNDWFGASVSMSFGGPNNVPLLAVGKPNEDAPGAGNEAGGFTVFRLVNGWSMLDDAWNANGQGGEQLGASIGLADPYLIAGAPGFNNGQGRARIYRRPDGASGWFNSTDVTILPANSPSGASFGSAVAISAYGGGWAVVGAPNHGWGGPQSGSAYFYTRDPNTNQWNHNFQIWGGDFGGNPADHRGEAVAMSRNTPWAAVGSPDAENNNQPLDHGTVAIVQRMANGNVSGAVQTVTAPVPEEYERFGAAVAIDGNWLVVGGPKEDLTFQESGFLQQAIDSGAVYLFENLNDTWTFRAKLRSPLPVSNGRFGSQVALNGSQFTVNEPQTGKVYVFALQNGAWSLQQTLSDPDSVGGGSFGNSVGVYQGLVAVGDKFDDHGGTTDVGAVYVRSIAATTQNGDLCGNPLALPAGDFIGCTQDATPSPGTPTTCGNGGSGQGNDVWFSFQPECDGNAIFDTFGSEFDTVLSVHSDCPTIFSDNTIVCSDDHTFPAPNNRASLVTLSFTGGQNYLIRVSGYNGASGQYTLRSNFFYGVNNDLCQNATTVAVGSYNFNTCGATNSAFSNGAVGANRDIWYRFIAPSTGWYQFDTCGSSFDTALAIFNGTQQSCPTQQSLPIAVNDDSLSVCQPGQTSLQSSKKLSLNAGQSLLVRVGGYASDDFGPGVLTISTTTQCNDIDFNNDGSVFDPTDIDAFLSVYSEGPCIPAANICDSVDFNNDGSVFDPTDIDAFLSVFSEGPCF